MSELSDVVNAAAVFDVFLARTFRAGGLLKTVSVFVSLVEGSTSLLSLMTTMVPSRLRASSGFTGRFMAKMLPKIFVFVFSGARLSGSSPG